MNKVPLPSAFRKVIISRSILSMATQVQSVVLGWQMYQLTKSPLLLGFIGLAEAVPALGIALWAGVVVDKGNPATIFNWILKLSFVSMAIMAFSQIESTGIPSLTLFGLSGAVLGLFCASFVAGLCRAFVQPSMYALIPRIVPRDQLSHASAWAATWRQLARVAGPALGGVLMALVGIYGSAIAIGGSLIVAILSSVGPTEGVIESEVKPVESAGQREDLLSGLVFVWNHPILLPALSIDMVCVLFGGVTALLPVYADQVLHTGAEGLGALRAAPAIGAAFMGYVLTSVDLRARAGQYFLWAVAGFGVSTIAFSLSTSFWISLVALFMAGLFDSVSVVVRSSAVQLCSPPDMRGRISSVNTMFIGSSNEIGEVESGVLAHYIGTVPTAVFGGIMCLVVLAVAAVKSPKLRALDLRALE